MDSLPADLYLQVLGYDDRDPTGVISHTAYVNRWGDPPDKIMAIDPSDIPRPNLTVREWRQRFGDGPTLEEVRRRYDEGQTHRNVRNVRFDFSLSQFDNADPIHTHVYIVSKANYLLELFTDEENEVYRPL